MKEDKYKRGMQPRRMQETIRMKNAPKVGDVGALRTLAQCNVSQKMEHAGIARGTTVGLSVPISLTSYRG